MRIPILIVSAFAGAARTTASTRPPRHVVVRIVFPPNFEILLVEMARTIAERRYWARLSPAVYFVPIFGNGLRTRAAWNDARYASNDYNRSLSCCVGVAHGPACLLEG